MVAIGRKSHQYYLAHAVRIAAKMASKEKQPNPKYVEALEEAADVLENSVGWSARKEGLRLIVNPTHTNPTTTDRREG